MGTLIQENQKLRNEAALQVAKVSKLTKVVEEHREQVRRCNAEIKKARRWNILFLEVLRFYAKTRRVFAGYAKPATDVLKKYDLETELNDTAAVCPFNGCTNEKEPWAMVCKTHWGEQWNEKAAI